MLPMFPNLNTAIGENLGRGHPIESAVFPELRGIVVKKSLVLDASVQGSTGQASASSFKFWSMVSALPVT
jgi:hypothetical protein